MKSLDSVTHRHVTAEHYMDGSKYMIWYYLEHHPEKTVGIVQVRGLSQALTRDELKIHIDKLWERYHKEKEYKNGSYNVKAS